MSTNKFSVACDDYRYLRTRGYPEKATLKIVADRHRLSRQERNCLFRGVIAPEGAKARKAKIIPLQEAAGAPWGVDWYNVLITVESYLHGHAVFLCDDGMVRDSSGTHGSYRVSAVTNRARDAVITALSAGAPARVDIYLDAPIAFSAKMAEDLRQALAAARVTGEVALVHSADYPLKRYEGIVASSDSTIMDSAARALDLARHALLRSFGFTPPAVEELFS